MNHEERFERIDQRLEAIATDLEIVAGMQLNNEKAIAANERAIATLAQHTIQAMDAINRLANIAEAHQQRIEDLEHGKQ